MRYQKHNPQLTCRLLEILNEKPWQSVEELAKQANYSRSYVSWHLRQMYSEGSLLTKQGGGLQLYAPLPPL